MRRARELQAAGGGSITHYISQALAEDTRPVRHSKYTVARDRVLQTVQTFCEANPMSGLRVSAAVRLSGFARPTVQRHLDELEHDGIIASALTDTMVRVFFMPDAARRRGHFLAASRSFSSPIP